MEITKKANHLSKVMFLLEGVNKFAAQNLCTKSNIYQFDKCFQLSVTIVSMSVSDTGSVKNEFKA